MKRPRICPEGRSSSTCRDKIKGGGVTRKMSGGGGGGGEGGQLL